MLELSLTRIFSVVFYYHFAFLAISVALFGLGVGGVFSYVVAGWRGSLFGKLGALAAADALCVVASLAFILSQSGELGYVRLAVVYLASALPFFLSGAIVSLAISEAIERIDRAYFFDLAGAAAGCLLLIPFLNVFGGPNTVITAGVFFAAAAAIWFNLAGAARARAGAVLIALLLVMTIVVNFKSHLVDVRYAKGGRIPQEQFVAWNSFSRIGVFFAGGWAVAIDADASTAIAPFDWDHLTDAQRNSLLHVAGIGLPYVLRPGAKTLILGAGGGYDVARALASGSRDITAVEINPIIANTVMRDKFAAQSHRLYFRPEVRVFVEDGRSFVRRSAEKYQVLQATLVDTWASTAAGAFALSENNLYTSDAFYDYLTHLTDDGVLTFTRWGFDPPRESLRLISLAMEALQRLGETEPQQHVIVIRSGLNDVNKWGALDTVMISRKPFSAHDIGSLLVQLKRDPRVLYAPGEPADNPFGKLLRSGDPEKFFAEYPYDVSPVDDDRPFFFYTVQPQDLWAFALHPTQAIDYKVNRAVPLLFSLMAVSLLATALILVLPRIVLRSRLPKQKGVVTFLWYFLCLGAGYILIQVALIQKFVLLLGHPTYALTVIVFSMLVASGAGSYFSRRVGGSDAGLMVVLGGVAVMVAVLAFAAPPLTAAAAGWPLGAKMALTTAAIAPAAFLMGMPFPSGLRRLERRHAPSVRWAWSLNAAASVMGSAAAIVLAIYLGLRMTLLIGGALYLAALLVIFVTRRRTESAPQPG